MRPLTFAKKYRLNATLPTSLHPLHAFSLAFVLCQGFFCPKPYTCVSLVAESAICKEGMRYKGAKKKKWSKLYTSGCLRIMIAFPFIIEKTIREARSIFSLKRFYRPESGKLEGVQGKIWDGKKIEEATKNSICHRITREGILQLFS